MMNVLSKPVINGSFNINSILDDEKARANGDIVDEAEIAKREAELREMKDEYYNRGKEEVAREFEKKADEIKERAYKDGMQNGKNKALKELESKYLAMKTIFDKWNEGKSKFLSELESEALELVLAIEKKIVGYEIQKNEKPLKHVIKNAINMINNKKRLRIRVSKEDEEYFKQGAMDFTKTIGEDVTVVCDHDIDQGGCVIETVFGDVDASMQTRWDMIISTFFTGIERGDNDILKELFTETGEGEPSPAQGESDQDSRSIG